LSAWANGIAHEKTTIRWYVDGMLWSGHNDNYRFGTRLPARAYPYEFMVKVSNGNGCFVESAPFEVMVHENPVVNITATETVICGGGEITMTANLNDYNTEFITYQWYKNTRNEADLIDGATRIDYTTTLEESASFIVAVEQTHSGCLVYDTIQIKVEEPMVLDSIKIDYTEICEGGQIIMEAKTSGGVAGGETYTWYKNGQRIPDAITATLIETPATVDFELTTYIYSVAVAQTASGCQTGLVDSLSVEVTVKPNPTVAIEGDPIVCEAGDNNITLIAHVDPTGNEDAYTYTWYEDNRILEVESNDTIKMQRDYRDHAYNFHVVVSGQNGCSVASDVFYAYVNDAPIVNIFASESEICAGGEVTLTAALNNWNAEQLELQWYKDSTLMPGETSLTYTTTLYDTAKFYLTVEQRNSDCLGANMEITVNVVPIPVIDTVIISETQICEGGQVTLTAEISGGVTGNEVYTWRKNGFVINGATGSTFTESPMPAGNDETRYTYSVEVTQGAAGCASDKKSSLELTVYPNPRVMISGDHHICETEAVFLIANVNHDSQEVGPLSYKWFEHTQYRDNLANGLGDNQFFSEYFYASENPYEFTVEVNRGNGCVSVSEKFHLYVHKQPVVNITATETEICENGVITLKANLDDYNQKYMTTQWFTREFVKESVKTGYDEDGNYTYTDINKEVITDIPGATENEYTAYFTENTEIGVRVMQTISDCYDIDMIMINVYDRPVVDSISVLSGYTAICDGGQIRLKANYSGGVAGKAIYTWYKNDVKIEGADKATLIDSPLSVDGDLTLYKYEVKVTLAASGCESEFSDAVLITVKPSPTVHISANSSLEYCETGSVILTANVAPDGDYNYAWYRDNRLVGNDATYTSSDLARETSYKYHVVVTEHPGCDVVSEPVEVTVIGQPIVTVELDNPTICEGGVATFTAHVRGGINDVNGLGQYEYAWHNNLVPEVLGTNATYTIPNNLDVDVYSYYVTVKSKYGCETTAYAENLQIVKDPEVTIRVAQGYDNVVCDGGTTMLTADIQYGFGTPSYQWYKNGNILVGETHQTLLTDELYYNVTAAYTVHVKMSGVDCEGKSEQFNVTVSPRHEIEITGNGNVCVGGTVTLTATLIDELLDGETLTYQWYRVHGGANSAILNATSVQYTTSELQLGDSYEYYVVATSSISGCTFTSGTVPANVVADPTVVLTAPTSICEGGDLVLQAFVYGGVDGVDYTYTWTKRLGSDVTQIETNEPTLTLNSLDPTSPSNLYYFTVTINRTDNTGCDATSNQVSVGVTPSVIVNVTMDNETVCQGTPITFTANVKPVGVYNYEWYVNDVLRGYNQSLTISNLPAGTTNNIYVKAIPINADNICQATSAVVHPVVNANPVVTSVIAEETTLCVGGSTTIKIATIDGQPFTNENDYTYQWSRNGIEIGGTLNSSIEQE
ncbi:hypothetical protein LJC67_07495, partial [Bacteroidales bacterium OttesenSCG-928-A14]|nr:hypothetical protein [Bacteroidales bacterium OttesenSCG-928-A14]